MKTMKFSLTLILALIFMSACKKDLSLELAGHAKTDAEKALDLKTIVSSAKFQLKAFYSDIPLDFIENDAEVKQETNLWSYVSEYLKDDVNTFSDNEADVEIEQNAMKKPGLNDPVIQRKYLIGTDADGAYMKFLDNEYMPLKYRLSEVHDNFFILSIKWKHGATLFSRFEKLP